MNILIIIVLAIVIVYLYNLNDQKIKTIEKLNSEINYLRKKYTDKYDDFTPIITEHKKKTGKETGYSQEDIMSFSLKKIDREYLYPKKDLEDKTHFFYDKKVVITGDFNHFQDRNEMARLLWEVGADVDTGIGKNTQVLVVGDNPGPSKMMTAEDMNLEIVTENEFFKLFQIVE